MDFRKGEHLQVVDDWDREELKALFQNGAKDLFNHLVSGKQDTRLPLDFRRMNLDGCNLRGFDLRQVALGGSSLKNVSLVGACLYGATMHGADFYGANITGCRLDGDMCFSARFADSKGWPLCSNDIFRHFVHLRLDRACLPATNHREVRKLLKDLTPGKANADEQRSIRRGFLV